VDPALLVPASCSGATAAHAVEACRIASGDAVVIQGKDTFKSDRITYDRVKSVVKGGAAAKGKERVRIRVDPKGREQAAGAKKAPAGGAAKKN
jgi:lipopolysaccharide export system protein LptA